MGGVKSPRSADRVPGAAQVVPGAGSTDPRRVSPAQLKGCKMTKIELMETRLHPSGAVEITAFRVDRPESVTVLYYDYPIREARKLARQAYRDHIAACGPWYWG